MCCRAGSGKRHANSVPSCSEASWTFVISRTDASRNQGNSSNGTNNSRSPTNSQNPCGDTLVTSTGEVLGPGGADLIEVLLDQGLNFRDLLWLETEVRGQLNGAEDTNRKLVPPAELPLPARM